MLHSPLLTELRALLLGLQKTLVLSLKVVVLLPGLQALLRFLLELFHQGLAFFAQECETVLLLA
jgi:hypothetical protein